MARKTKQTTQQELDAMADKADDLAFEISAVADAMQKDILSEVSVIKAAGGFNRLAEMCGSMNRALLAIARHRDDIASLKQTLRVED